MNQYRTERRLTWCYTLLSILLGISVICIAITYNHWRTTLDVCPGSWLEYTNCGCIFFGVSTYQYFNGGHYSNCLYAVFAPLPILIYAIVMTIFHMYRVCISNIGKYEDDKSTEMEEIEGESIVVTTRSRVSQNNDSIIYCWIPTACLAAVFAVYNVIHAGIITAGFLKTCTQYREYLAREVNAAGNQATAIHSRLSCQAIFDFMDFLQINAQNNRRGDLNTGIALHMAVICSWLAVGVWILVIWYTSARAYRERNVLTCCGN